MLPEVRQRIAGTAGLVVIEITVDESLERYPWELIAGPGALGDICDVAVFRRVEAPPPQKPKQWSNVVLLAGSEAMRSGATYVHAELDLIESELEGSRVTVRSDSGERSRARAALRLRRLELKSIRMKLQWALEDIP